MNTFILFWNPQISNFKDTERTDFVQALRTGATYEFNWAIWDWQQAHAGDRFFRLRCGMPNPADDGVIDSGYFVCDPYADEDWSGRGRKVYYAEMEFDAVLDFNHCPLLTSEKLDLRIPHFDWHGGHSGRLLNKEDSDILESLWSQHLDDITSSNSKTKDFVFIMPPKL